MKTKKPTRAEKEAKPLREDLIARVIEAKKKLPKSGITSFFLQINPEHDNVKGRSLLGNVLQFRSTDEEITVKLEKLAELVNKEIK